MEATNRQLWALKCATGIDYRGQGLTKEEASKMLAQANERSGYGKQSSKRGAAVKAENELIVEFRKRVPQIIEACYQRLCETTLRCASTVGIEGDERRYVMLGRGCGFAYIRFDKRSKKMAEYNEYCRGYFMAGYDGESEFQRAIAEKVPVKVQRELAACGNPLMAILSQDLDIASTFYHECAGIAVGLGYKCYVETFID